jgi:Cd2+/Zn2+-exporting ATPase
MNKYKLKNVSCASCADRIEKELTKIPGVKSVHINFAASTLNIDYNNTNEIRRIVQKTEPGSDIEEFTSSAKSPGKPSSSSRELIKIIAVIALFIAGMIFREYLQSMPYSIGEYIIFLSAYLLSGWGVLYKAGKDIFRGKLFDENFLMTIATGGAIIIGELPEAAGVMIFYSIGEYVQSLAVRKSRRSIKALLEIRPDYTNLKTADGVKKISPAEVQPGDLILVKAGEKIPLDGIVAEGFSYVNTFALTGEPVPRYVKQGDTVLSGMINTEGSKGNSGLLTVRVTAGYDESTISKILELVENAAAKKSKTEKFITTFARYYTPVVVVIALAVALLPPLLAAGQTFEDWIYRALVILVISCPCALVISIPLGYFGGIGGASARGIMIKGSGYLDVLTKVKKVVFDKTGTLTKGVFNVTEVVSANGYTKEDITYYAAAAESHSNHPVAKSIAGYFIEKYPGKSIPGISDYNEVPGQGIKAKTGSKTIIAGSDRLLHNENIPHNHNNCVVDGTVVHVAINSVYAGYIVISDEIKHDAENAIRELTNQGIETIMLTGDNGYSAKMISEKLGIHKYYADLLPQDKVACLEKIMSENEGGKTAFAGDGINDAPVITRADVGFAMGGLGSDAAVEAADIVIMEDDPAKVAEAIHVAKSTRTIVWQNILFAMGVKAFFIALGAAGEATMWEAVFADMGVAVIAIFNSTRLLRK